MNFALIIAEKITLSELLFGFRMATTRTIIIIIIIIMLMLIITVEDRKVPVLAQFV